MYKLVDTKEYMDYMREVTAKGGVSLKNRSRDRYEIYCTDKNGTVLSVRIKVSDEEVFVNYIWIEDKE